MNLMKCNICRQEVDPRDHKCPELKYFCPTCGKHRNFCICEKRIKDEAMEVDTPQSSKRINIHNVIENEIHILEYEIKRLKELNDCLPKEVPEYASEFLRSLVKLRRQE